MIAWLVACMPDDWTGTPWRPTDTGGASVPTQALVGAWRSEGEDVSPLLAGEPFRYVAVEASFGHDGAYDVVATDVDGANWPVAGRFVAVDGAPGTVVVSQSEPYEATAEGIWQVDAGVLSWEIVQTIPDYGFTPPTAETGFGSSAGAGLAAGANLQRFRAQ